MPSHADSPFMLFPPPYRSFLPIVPEESFPSRSTMVRGTAVIWTLRRGQGRAVFEWIRQRPPGLSLVVVLPPGDELASLEGRALEVAERARPHSVLPHHPGLTAEEMVSLLRREPPDLAAELVDHLTWREMPLDQDTRRIIRRIVELSSELTTLKAVCRGLYLSRRALGRRFRRRGLPVPSHWLQFSRLLRAASLLQGKQSPLFNVACTLGYPDGFTLSNQMERMVGVRPTVAKKRLGLEWFMEAWLETEWQNGGLRLPLRHLPERKGKDGDGASQPEPQTEAAVDLRTRAPARQDMTAAMVAERPRSDTSDADGSPKETTARDEVESAPPSREESQNVTEPPDSSDPSSTSGSSGKRDEAEDHGSAERSGAVV